MIPWKESSSAIKQNLISISGQLKQKYSSGILLKIQQAINQITGYDSCERLKELVLQKDLEYGQMKEKTNSSRLVYFQTIDDEPNANGN